MGDQKIGRSRFLKYLMGSILGFVGLLKLNFVTQKAHATKSASTHLPIKVKRDPRAVSQIKV